MNRLSFLLVCIISPLLFFCVSCSSQATEPLDAGGFTETIHTSAPQYTTQAFFWRKQDGGSLVYQFQNDGAYPCTVQLCRVDAFQQQTAVSEMTVPAREIGEGNVLLSGDGTYTFRIQCDAGISSRGDSLSGTLSASYVAPPSGAVS